MSEMPGVSYEGCIGAMDSGVGGISVLKAMAAELPHERFVFFGDSDNAPYGEKSRADVMRLASAVIEPMINGGAKAVVIACNTATSVAAQTLRERYPYFPIVGVEPALKPATLAEKHDNILVMATSVTIKLEKFHKLAREYGSNSNIIAVPCVGLAKMIETGNLDSPQMHQLLESLIGKYRGKVDSVVLGCTHYPFVKRQIREVLGDVPFYDGGEGTARQLKRLLSKRGALAPETSEGSIEFATSSNDPAELELYRWFYSQPI